MIVRSRDYRGNGKNTACKGLSSVFGKFSVCNALATWIRECIKASEIASVNCIERFLRRAWMPGIVYVLTNPTMPGLVKIGKTDGRLQDRMKDLFRTGVPVPFTCVKAVKVKDEDAVERALHEAFAPSRINDKREFFEIEPDQIFSLLDELGTKDVTPLEDEESDEVDAQSIQAAKRLISRRPNLNFYEMGIGQGSILRAARFDDLAEVVDEKKVIFRNEEMYLTAATKILLRIEYPVSGAPHWRFEGKLLSDIYEDFHSDDKKLNSRGLDL